MLPFYEELANRFQELHKAMVSAVNDLPEEALDWKPGNEMNSLSVIITHVTGSERFLIGDVVMLDPSNRNRDAEFLVKGVIKEDLIHRLNGSDVYLRSAFEELQLSDLEAMRLHPRRGIQVSVSWALLHALEHTGTHLGHIELTFQLWQERNGDGVRSL
jgi:Protein of unknown function (DUF1572)